MGAWPPVLVMHQSRFELLAHFFGDSVSRSSTQESSGGLSKESTGSGDRARLPIGRDFGVNDGDQVGPVRRRGRVLEGERCEGLHGSFFSFLAPK